MTDISVEKEILDEIHKLGEDQQKEVLEFVRSLASFELVGVPGKHLLRFAGTINKDDLQKMSEAIQGDCERVDQVIAAVL
jgi:hypothetical protein